MALLEGIKVKLGTVEFTVPPLNIKALRILGPRFSALQAVAGSGKPEGMFEGDHLDTLIEVVHAAIVRNHPEVTKDELENLVDLGNLQEVFAAVCAQSGMQKGGPKGEAKGPRNR